MVESFSSDAVIGVTFGWGSEDMEMRYWRWYGVGTRVGERGNWRRVCDVDIAGGGESVTVICELWIVKLLVCQDTSWIEKFQFKVKHPEKQIIESP